MVHCDMRAVYVRLGTVMSKAACFIVEKERWLNLSPGKK